MTLRGDVQQYVAECHGDSPWEADTFPVVKHFRTWEARELVALGAILILMGGSIDLDQTMESTCKLHNMMHMHQDVTAITENLPGD